MKKLIFLFALVGLFILGIQNANAQWEILVEWDDQCSGCPGGGAIEYEVCYTIYNICTSQPVDSDCVIKSSGSTSHTFDVGEICDIDEQQVCFRVSVAVTKRCVSNQSTICRETDSDDVNCYAIYNNGVSFDLLLES
ncbi:MAG: hypothetical protein U9R60_00355 [Bacteroidota bacterium]|nr:hypothetical protein [Bacteroidota bacterium]